MKLSALQQSNRRSGSFRGSAPLDSSSPDGSIRSPAAIFWLVLHGLCCLVSLVLGFRFSRLVFFFLFSTTATTTTTTNLLFPAPFRSVVSGDFNRSLAEKAFVTASSGSRVVVGRHGIRIRPWPHPDPIEVMKAHQIIDTVQGEQRRQFGVKAPRTLIAVTPTYVRTFQALHMTGLMHSLMLVPYDVVWIVVEAGGMTNETASILAKSGLRNVHVGFDQRMPNSWEGRHRLEARMRLRGLRTIRDQKLDGIVMFADDSNMHSMELFDEIQNVKWFGAFSIGVLSHSGDTDESDSIPQNKEDDEQNQQMPVQGPACNSSNKLVGWHTFNSRPYTGKTAIYIDDRATVLPKKMEWSGFVLNSRVLWKEAEDKPEWVKDLGDLDGVGENIESPLFLLKDTSMVEPLGSCGRQIFLWWLRVEARFDSKFPSRWMIDPQLEVTVPAKRTPWPDAPPELPTTETLPMGIEEHTAEHSTKSRSPRSKRRSKRKHDMRTVETQESTTHTEQNLPHQGTKERNAA